MMRSLTNTAEILESESTIPEVVPMACRTQLQWGRKALHVGAALIGLWLYGIVGLSRGWMLGVLGVWLVISITTEILRSRLPRFNTHLCRYFSGIMRERERYGISSATWYIISMWAVFLVCPKSVALIVLWLAGVGDTAAGVVGARWGRLRLNRHVSIEGMAAAFVVSFIGAILMASTGFAGLHVAQVVVIPFAGLVALVGVLAESLFPQFDDNLVIPLLSAPAVWGLVNWFT